VTVNAAWNLWNFRRALLSALIADGHRVTVLAPADEYVTELEQLGCRFIPLAMDVKGLNPLRDALLVWQLRRIFAEHRPDVVLSYTIKNNIFGAFAAKSLGVPFVPNVTGLGTGFLSGGLLQTLVEALYRRAFAGLPIVFFQNEDDRGQFIQQRLVQSEQARLLPGSGIDLEHFAPAGDGSANCSPTFLMVARLLRDKGVKEFAEAARLVKSRFPAVRFQLLGAAGSANRSAIDLATVTAWQSTYGIEYLGTSSDVREQIAAADCVVLPSYREGAPRTLIEAAAMARPVIATDVPGCRAVLEQGRTGFLCAPRSSASLAEACLRFVELGPAERLAMGKAGRAKMESEYDQALVLAAYRAALGTVLADRPVANLRDAGAGTRVQMVAPATWHDGHAEGS
jgi:glycosyltransferase involved in cell wall biosynthesis